VDQLKKSALFIPIKMTNSVDKMGKIYVNEMAILHRLLISMVSEMDPRFTSGLWPRIQCCMGTKLNLSIAFHPHSNG